MPSKKPKKRTLSNQLPRVWRERMQNTLNAGKSVKDFPAPPVEDETLDNIHRHPLLKLAEKVNEVTTDVEYGFGFDMAKLKPLAAQMMDTASSVEEGDIVDHIVDAAEYLENLIQDVQKGAPFDEQYIAYFYMLQHLRRVPDEFDQYFVNLPAPDEALVLGDGSVEHPLDYQYPSVTDGDYERSRGQAVIVPASAIQNSNQAKPLDTEKAETGYRYPAYPTTDDQDMEQRPFSGVCPVPGDCGEFDPGVQLPEQSNILPGGLGHVPPQIPTKSGYNQAIKRVPPILANNPAEGNINTEYDWEDRSDGLFVPLVVGDGTGNTMPEHGLDQLNQTEYGLDDKDYVTMEYDMPFNDPDEDASILDDFLLDSIDPDDDGDIDDLDDGGYDIDEDDEYEDDDETDVYGYNGDIVDEDFDYLDDDIVGAETNGIDFSGLTDDLLTDIVQNISAIPTIESVAKAEDRAARRSLQLQRRQELRDKLKMEVQPKSTTKASDLSMRQILAAFQRARDLIMANNGGWVLTNVFFSGLSEEEVSALADENLIKVAGGKMTLTREGWEKPQYFSF